MHNIEGVLLVYSVQLVCTQNHRIVVDYKLEYQGIKKVQIQNVLSSAIRMKEKPFSPP